MSFTHTITKTYQGPDGTLSYSNSYSDAAISGFDETIANGASNQQITCNIDVSEVASLYLVSDQAVTFETNSGGTPTNTINLLADKPYMWQSDDYAAFLLTGDVTAVFITNSSGSSATVRLRVLYDSTP